MKINWLYIEMSGDFSSLNDYMEMQISQRERIAKEEAKKSYLEFCEAVSDEEERQGVSEESIESDLIDSLKYTAIKTMIVFLSDRSEYYLRRLCKAIQNEVGDTISYSDFVGNPIEKANRYFIHLKREAISDEYLSVFNEIQKIRNCIVHNNSRVDDCKDKTFLEKLCERSIGIKITRNELIISEEYVSEKLRSVSTIIHRIFSANGWGTVTREIAEQPLQPDSMPCHDSC